MESGDYDCRTSGRPCCAGLYCEGSFSYYEGHCMELVPDGEWCDPGFRRCASGRCEDGICRSAACVSVGTECAGLHAECCTGFCDHGFAYGPGFCRDRQPAGVPCYDGSWCISGSCRADGVCD
jgi:hypothetical protein